MAVSPSFGAPSATHESPGSSPSSGVDPVPESAPKRLAKSAPPGTIFNPTTGVLSWTPTEAQGTNQYPIVVRVTDDGEPARDTFQVVVIFVAESNEPPVLAVISNRTAFPGDLVTFVNSTMDPDLPANTFTYSLGAGAPLDASVVPSTGVFSWLVPANQPVSTNAVTVFVSDNGFPSLSNSRTFKVIVGPLLQITSIVDAGGSVIITAPATSGRNYTLVTKDDLSTPGGWPASGTTQTATNPTVIFAVPATNSQRFYRVILEP